MKSGEVQGQVPYQEFPSSDLESRSDRLVGIDGFQSRFKGSKAESPSLLIGPRGAVENKKSSVLYRGCSWSAQSPIVTDACEE